MQMRKATFIAGLLAALYGAAIGIAADTPPAGVAQAKSQVTDAAQAVNAPEPGSPGDTLTREDKRMAYLVYKLLDKKGKIKEQTSSAAPSSFTRTAGRATAKTATA